MAKQEEESRAGDLANVWRPAGFQGVEIAVKRNRQGFVFPKSILLNYCMVLNGVGAGRVRYGRRNYTFANTQGLVFIQQPGETFSGEFRGATGTSGACIEIPESVMQAHQEHLGLPGPVGFSDLLAPEPSNNHAAACIQQAIDAFQRRASRLECESALLNLIGSVVSFGSARTLERRAGKEHRAVSLMRDLFHECPDHDHSLNDLARLTGMNAKYLVTVFKRDVGVTPHRYLTKLRIERSKFLLAAGSRIAEVAIDLGFADQSHFTHTFHRYVHVTPRKFRARSLAT
jgi:AraC-like DNA-binding protein